MAGDDTIWKDATFDDSKWTEVNPSLSFNDSAPPFQGIGWFRLHLIADTDLTSVPLAMTITHFGASEIFLDGKLIKSFGKINGPDSSIYIDPQELPFIFLLDRAGNHVLSVRYANYKAEKNYLNYKRSFAGFKMMIGDTDVHIQQKDLRTTVASFILMLLTGLFLALCLIHFLMYMYYRSEISNLYFSILMLSLASVFIIFFINYASHTPSLMVVSYYFLNPVFLMAGLALSGFIAELFGKSKVRFKIYIVLATIIILLRIVNFNYYSVLSLGFIITVSFDALFTVIFAIAKRVRGARIIGAGILFSTAFIITLFASAIASGGNLDLNDNTTGGRIMVIFFGLAIISIPVSMSVHLAWNFSSVNKRLAAQLDEVKVLSEKSLQHEQEKQRMLQNKQQELEEEVQKRTAELQSEKKKSDDLLLNILPAEVAEELKEKGRTNAKTYSMVTVMFTDFKDFTDVSEKISAELLVAEIDYCFSAFDHIIQKHDIEKIKTIGDAYICASGLRALNFTHAVDMINAAREIRDFMLQRKKEKEERGEIPFELRIGIHTGAVVAGIVGVKKFAYDIWGDTVNVAARMEQNSEAGKINISGTTYQLVKTKFNCLHRGKIQAKNKGEIDMYFVEGVV
jgi:adenylate cyclase